MDATTNPVFIDLETRSACDLRDRGGWTYAADPTTRLLTVAWRDGETDHVWLPGAEYRPAADPFVRMHLSDVVVHWREEEGYDPPKELLSVMNRDWVAHNAHTFDQLVWEDAYGCWLDWQPRSWIDTYPLALAVGLPGGIDKIGRLLWGEGKYEDGKSAMLKASFAEGPHDCDPVNVPLAQAIMVAKYNVQDVRLLASLWPVLQRECKQPETEQRIRETHRAINHRGVRIDRGLVESLIRLNDASRGDVVKQIASLTEGKLATDRDLQSRVKVFSWLSHMGIDLGTSLRKQIVERWIDANDPDESEQDEDGETGEPPKNLSLVIRVLKLRSSFMRVTGGKLNAALGAMCADDRARGAFTYHGAHTGRAAGRRIQLQNLPRPDPSVPVWKLLDLHHSPGGLRFEDVAGLCDPHEAASALLRSIVIPDPGCLLLTADLAQIECRVLAWLAGEQWLLDTFWADGDPYLLMAEAICGPKERWPNPHGLPFKKHPYRQNVGKIPELAAGFQMGPSKLALYAANMGVDMADFGTTPEKCILAYRRTHPAIAGQEREYMDHVYFRGGLWDKLNHAAIKAVDENGIAECGRITFRMQGPHLACVLPSGRAILYRNAHMGTQTFKHAEREHTVTNVVKYTHPRYGVKHMYPGAWCWAAGTRIVTNKGVLPIEAVTAAHKIWDGETFVACGGAIYRGKKRTGSWLGERVTGDHLIDVGGTWKSVMRLGVQSTERCLLRGRRSAILLSKSAGAGSEPSRMFGAGFAEELVPYSPGALCGRKPTAALDALGSNAHGIGRISGGWQHSSPTPSSDLCGVIGTREWSPAAQTKNTRHIITTGAEGFLCGVRGSTIVTRSSSMRVLSRDGTTRRSIWTDGTTTADMNRETFVWLPDRSTAETGGEDVYDLLNCGPRHQYSVVTDYGMIVAHNCENIVQAISRDVMAEAMPELDARGLPVVLHCHDEVGSCGPESRLPEFLSVFTTPPEWLTGFPLDADGCGSSHYAKSPPPGVKETLYRNGARHG